MAKIPSVPTIIVGDVEIPVNLYFEVVELHQQQHHIDNIVYKIICKQHIADVSSFRQAVSQIVYNQKVMQNGLQRTSLSPFEDDVSKQKIIDKRRLSRIQNLDELDDLQSTEKIVESQDTVNIDIS